MVNPDGLVFDIGGRTARPGHYRSWRKNRQPNGRRRAIGTDLNRNYDYDWACCGGSSGSKSSITEYLFFDMCGTITASAV